MSRLLDAVAVGSVFALSACYQWVPVETEPPPVGEHVAFQITDRGRVGLAERLGPGITRVEGRLTRAAADELTLNVSRVGQMNGVNNRWSGESVRIGRDFISTLQTKQLSRRRTFLAASATAIAVVLLARSNNLFGAFSGTSPDDPGVPPPSSYRGIP